MQNIYGYAAINIVAGHSTGSEDKGKAVKYDVNIDQLKSMATGMQPVSEMVDEASLWQYVVTNDIDSVYNRVGYFRSGGYYMDIDDRVFGFRAYFAESDDDGSDDDGSDDDGSDDVGSGNGSEEGDVSIKALYQCLYQNMHMA
ncbi:hypothetical protein CEP53_000474 [Fusarium sp. AF-6]|nr:hypothetical protein CEP53_000474 [Fusarium sp. AF-6]